MDDSGNTGNLLTLVKDAINTANARRATEYPWRFMLTTVAATIATYSSTTQSFTLPTDVQRPLYVYNRTQDKYFVCIPERHFTEYDASGSGGTVLNDGLDARCVIRGANQYIQMLRPQATGDTVEIVYYRRPTNLSANGDFPDIPWPHSELLKWDALIMLKAYAAEPDAITVWQDQQQQALGALYANYGDGSDMLGGEVEYVKYVGW